MKYRNKETVEAVTFEEFVEIGLNTPGANIRDGVPWSFEYKGSNVTHETHDQYLISGNKHGGWLFSMQFERGDFLVTGEDGEIFSMSPDALNDNYEEIQPIADRKECQTCHGDRYVVDMQPAGMDNAWSDSAPCPDCKPTEREEEDPDGNVYVITPESDLEAIKKALEV